MNSASTERTDPIPLGRPCMLLPEVARGLLIRATRYVDPGVRRMEIDKAIEQVKHICPQYFLKPSTTKE